jgi:hypothetical protein
MQVKKNPAFKIFQDDKKTTKKTPKNSISVVHNVYNSEKYL